MILLSALIVIFIVSSIVIFRFYLIKAYPEYFHWLDKIPNANSYNFDYLLNNFTGIISILFRRVSEHLLRFNNNILEKGIGTTVSSIGFTGLVLRKIYSFGWQAYIVCAVLFLVIIYFIFRLL